MSLRQAPVVLLIVTIFASVSYADHLMVEEGLMLMAPVDGLPPGLFPPPPPLFAAWVSQTYFSLFP